MNLDQMSNMKNSPTPQQISNYSLVWCWTGCRFYL